MSASRPNSKVRELSFVLLALLSACSGQRSDELNDELNAAKRGDAAVDVDADSFEDTSVEQLDASAKESGSAEDAASSGDGGAGVDASSDAQTNAVHMTTATRVRPTLMHDNADTNAVSAAMVADLNGRPLVAVRARSTGFVQVWRLEDGDTSFTQIGSDVSARPVLSTPDLVVTADGTPHIAWLQANDDDTANELHASRFDGQRWAEVGPAIPVQNTTSNYRPRPYPNLAVDRQDRVLVAYATSNYPGAAGSSHTHAYVKRAEAGGWTDISPAPLETGSLVDLDLAIAPSGTPTLVLQIRGVQIEIWEWLNARWSRTAELEAETSVLHSSVTLNWFDEGPVVTWRAAPSASVKVWRKRETSWEPFSFQPSAAPNTQAVSVLAKGHLLVAVGAGGVNSQQGSVYRYDAGMWKPELPNVTDKLGWSGVVRGPYAFSSRGNHTYLAFTNPINSYVGLVRIDLP